MPPLRFTSVLIAVTSLMPPAHAGLWGWLFHHDVQVIVNTDVTPAGARLPPASREHPVYYVGVSMGYRDLGGIIAGDKLPGKKTMYAWIAKALAKQGYLPANAKHPATEIVAFAWGSLYVQRLSWDPDFPVQLNRGQMLRFLGGAKLGLISKNPQMPDFELLPELHFLRSSAERILTAAEDDLYMTIVSGYDLKAAEHKKVELLWRTHIACPSRGLGMADTLPKMVSIAAPLIARETDIPVWISATDRYKPVVKIGNPVVEEYLDSAPLPIVDESKTRSGGHQKAKK